MLYRNQLTDVNNSGALTLLAQYLKLNRKNGKIKARKS